MLSTIFNSIKGGANFNQVNLIPLNLPPILPAGDIGKLANELFHNIDINKKALIALINDPNFNPIHQPYPFLLVQHLDHQSSSIFINNFQNLQIENNILKLILKLIRSFCNIRLNSNNLINFFHILLNLKLAVQITCNIPDQIIADRSNYITNIDSQDTMYWTVHFINNGIICINGLITSAYNICSLIFDFLLNFDINNPPEIVQIPNGLGLVGVLMINNHPTQIFGLNYNVTVFCLSP